MVLFFNDKKLPAHSTESALFSLKLSIYVIRSSILALTNPFTGVSKQWFLTLSFREIDDMELNAILPTYSSFSNKKLKDMRKNKEDNPQ